MMIRNNLRRLLGAALFCGAGLAVQAQNPVTFQVDMNSQPSAATVYVKGSFDAWGAGQQLLNDGSGIYTGTVNIASSPGTVIACKFMYEPGGVWEGGADRQFVVAGGPQTLPLTSWDVKNWPVPTQNITFQVDMTAQIQINAFSHGQPMRISGAFTGWGDGVDMTNNPALTGDSTNIFSTVISVSGFPGGEAGQYKFRANNGWENDGVGPNGAQNRNFNLVGGDQLLPVVYYNNQAPQASTNADVTFRVDMTPQVLTGGFINGVNEVRVSGGFNGWGNGDLLTNNAALSTVESNIYSTTLSLTNFVNTEYFFKFRAQGGWESASIYGVGVNLDRHFFLTGGDQVLPLVTYNDASLCDLLLQPTAVTFVLHITNGTVTTDGTVFTNDAPSTRIFINGEFNGWQSWNEFLPQLANNPPGSDFYDVTINLPAGAPRAQKFKFGIIGPTTSNADNEAPQFQDHIQYVRTFNTSFTMPAAEFGTNYASVRVEPSFGNLKAGAPAAGNVPITWLGGPCVTLQTRSSLTSGSWTDLPATDAGSSTNWPNTGGSQMFRLQKRPLP